jgi:hopanoid biosynthesis associated RND transporter like protein HpnN
MHRVTDSALRAFDEGNSESVLDPFLTASLRMPEKEPRTLLTRSIVAIVDFSRRRALPIALAAVALAALLAVYAARHLSLDADTSNIVSSDAPFRKLDKELDQAFPQRMDRIVVVIDAQTPEQADTAARALLERLKQMPALFKSVQDPIGDVFFKREGVLFQSPEEVSETMEQLIRAQPMIGELAPDPSVRGLFQALSLSLEGVAQGEASLQDLERPFAAISESLEALLAGTPRPVSWQSLLTDRPPTPDDLRRILLVQPVLDYGALQPGAKANAALRDAARSLGLTSDHGIRVRLTGEVALSDEEFGSLTEGAAVIGGLSFSLLCLFLWLAVGSPRLVVAILGTLGTGLVFTAAFAAASIGSLNLISVAFAVLFVGIAVDFGIQFAVRYRDCRHRIPGFEEALRATAGAMATPLSLAAATTAVGFYSFVPSSYAGLRELGLIAGTGMLIALVLSFSLLPALITLLRPAGEPEPVGFPGAARIDHLLVARRREVALLAGLLALASIAALPRLHFDFDPLHLKNPRTESMATLLELMTSPNATPYTIDILAPSMAAAEELAPRLEALPEVDRVLTIRSFVPADQPEKLATVADTAFLLLPTMTPAEMAPAPSDAAVLAATTELVGKLHSLPPDASAQRFARALEGVLHATPPPLGALQATLVGDLPALFADLRLLLSAGPVTLETLPKALVRDWVSPDQRLRVEVSPKGDARDNTRLKRFVDAVRSVAPNAAGSPVTIQESARIVVRAFITAGVIALVAISLLLFAVLRRVLDTLLVLAPLLLAALLTLASTLLLGLPLNFANIIGLPLLLGIGVAFDIYFVTNWRSGLGNPLQSSTARAILCSGLTTGTAFGALAASSHPGTSQMGILLMLALGFTLLCTLLVLPSLLALAPHRGSREEKEWAEGSPGRARP